MESKPVICLQKLLGWVTGRSPTEKHLAIDGARFSTGWILVCASRHPTMSKHWRVRNWL